MNLSVWRHWEIFPEDFPMNLSAGSGKRVPRVYIKDGKECGEEESFFQ